MNDYPRDFADFESRFTAEAACRDYLFRLRWPQGFCCDRCGGRKAWRVSTTGNGTWECAECHRQTALTAGTIFQDSRLPLTLWFRAAWCVTSSESRVTAKHLQRILGLKSYKSAWTMLLKLRLAMGYSEQNPLTGRVAANGMYVDPSGVGVQGTWSGIRAMVAVLVEEQRRGIGRVRMRLLPAAEAECLVGYIKDSIEPGGRVRTCVWFEHMPVKNARCIDLAEFLMHGNELVADAMPVVHRIFSDFQNWLCGTHPEGVSLEHLDAYLNEFAFRFNLRRSRSPGKLFYRLLQQAVAIKPAPYESLVRRSKKSAPRNVMARHLDAGPHTSAESEMVILHPGSSLIQ